MVTLFVCGDVMLGRGIDQILPYPCDPTIYESYLHDARAYIELAEEVSGPIPRGVPPAYPWGDALAVLDAAHPDARIINLETSITRSGKPDLRKGINYRVSPDNARSLIEAHVDVCALGNNHVADWGVAGLLDTLATLDRLGIARCGAGHDADEALRPAVIELGERGRIVVFSIGCTDAGVPPWWAAGADRPGVHVVAALDDEVVHAVARATAPWRQPRTVIVLSIHWGDNWGYEIPGEHRRFARAVIDEAGVDLVHGHSSHHVKGIEVHRGRPILYGCGDLITDYEGIRSYEEYRGDLGLLYLVTFDPAGGLTRLELVPTQMRRFQLRHPSEADAAWLAATLGRAGERLGTRVVTEGNRLRLAW